MQEIFEPTTRRSVLARGLAVVAGVFGLEVVEKKSLAQEPTSRPPDGNGTFRLYGRRWQTHTPVRTAGDAASAGRLISQGELADQPNGEKTGEFHSTRFCLDSPFGLNPTASSNLEFQSFVLKDGTIFGMTTGGPASGVEKAHAIVGGTGRFAGARGAYVITRNAESGSSSVVEIVLTLTT